MKRQHILICAIAIALCLLGCGPQSPPAKPPLHLGLAFDVSGSAKDLPPLSGEEIARLCRLVARTGGKLAFAAIDESAKEPLDRLSLAPIRGPLNEQAARARENRIEIGKWQKRVLAAIQRRSARETDLLGVVNRFSLFFGEAAEVQKVLLVVSDCKHSGPRRKPVVLSGDIQVLVVGAGAERAKGVFSKAHVVESFQGALEILEGGR